MRMTLESRKEEVPGVESFHFKPHEPLSWKPGQFLHYVLHHEPTDDRGSDRWFTVSSAPSEGFVQITTRFDPHRSSSFKTELKNLKVGKEIEISDVDGDFTIDDPSAEYVFIAGGIGVTPFRSILKEADVKDEKLKVTLLYANRDENIPYKAEFEEFAAKNPHLKIHYVLSPERIDENLIKKQVPDLTKPIFYVSGPEPMVDAINKILEGAGAPKEHLKGDWFPGYPLE